MAVGRLPDGGVDAASVMVPADPLADGYELAVDGDVLAVLRLPARVEAVARARAVARAAFRALGVGRVEAEDGVLAVCELVTNALTHGVGPFELRVRAAADAVVCEVADGDAALVSFPAPPADGFGDLGEAGEPSGDMVERDAMIDALSVRGRGLGIVWRLSQGRCGCRLTALVGAVDGVGKAVWCAVPVRRV